MLPYLAAGLLLLVAVAAGGAWWMLRQGAATSGDDEAAATEPAPASATIATTPAAVATIVAPAQRGADRGGDHRGVCRRADAGASLAHAVARRGDRRDRARHAGDDRHRRAAAGDARHAAARQGDTATDAGAASDGDTAHGAAEHRRRQRPRRGHRDPLRRTGARRGPGADRRPARPSRRYPARHRRQPVAGATIRLLPDAGGPPAVTITGDDGTYDFAALAPGRYLAEIEHAGFRPARSRFTLVAGKQQLNLGLQPQP
jgi:hypothetical protein